MFVPCFISLAIPEVPKGDSISDTISTSVDSSASALISTSDLNQIIQQFVELNPQMRSHFKKIRALKSGYRKYFLSEFSPTISAGKSYTYDEDSQIGTSGTRTTQASSDSSNLNVEYQNSLGSIGSTYKKNRSEAKANIWATISEMESTLEEAIKIAFYYSITLEKFNSTSRYLNERREDLGEFKIRKKLGDSSKQEFERAEAELKRAEASYMNAMSEFESAKSSCMIYLGFLPTLEFEAINLLSEELDEENPENIKTSEYMRSVYASKAADAAVVSSVAALGPQVSLKYSENRKLQPEFDNAGELMGQAQIHQNNFSAGITFQVSGANFMQVFEASRNKESARYALSWAKKVSEQKIKSIKYEVSALKKSCEASKQAMGAYKINMDAQEAIYKSGTGSYSDLSSARSDYYDSMIRYLESKQRLLEKIVQEAKLKGKLKKFFIEKV